MDAIHFTRKPYTVYYKDLKTNEIVSTIRRPPDKITDILPTDVVELSYKKNDFFTEGDQYVVKNINPRHPNILQLQDGENTTFVSALDTELIEENGYRGTDMIDSPKANRYLTWP